jgi:hypothetical protein
MVPLPPLLREVRFAQLKLQFVQLFEQLTAAERYIDTGHDGFPGLCHVRQLSIDLLPAQFYLFSAFGIHVIRLVFS